MNQAVLDATQLLVSRTTALSPTKLAKLALGYNCLAYNLLLCCIIYVAFNSTVTFAANSIHNHLPLISVDQSRQSLLIGKQVEILEDVQGTLTLADLLKPSNQASFKLSQEEIPNFGFTSSVFWIRFKINNNDDHSNELILVADYPPLDVVELFADEQIDAALANGNLAPKRAGDSVNFSERDLADRAPSFHLNFTPNETKVFYMRVKSSSSMQLPLSLWSTKAFIDRKSNELLIWGSYLGALLIAAIYNFFLYLTIRDTVYVHYVLYVASIVAFQITINGLASQHLWPEFTVLTNYMLLIFLNGIGIFAAHFSKLFLRMASNTPLLNKALNVALGILYANLALAFFAPYEIPLLMSIAAFMFGTVVLIAAGIQAWYVGYKPARIYLIAWFTMLFGSFLYSLKTLGLVPNTIFTNYAVTIGSAVEIILLSFALGDRINTERDEKNKARKQLYDFQQKLMKANEDALEVSKQSDQLKKEFLATMSHELRTPMNGIIGGCQLLEENLVTGESQAILQSLNDSANQMMGLVNKVLNFSQLIEGKISVDRAVFHIDAVAAYIEETFGGRSYAKGLKFTVAVDPEVSGFYLGDKQKIQHILHDLTENAIKFTHQGRAQIHIQLSKSLDLNQKEKQIEFRVKDTGVGINKENLDKIFKMFTQGDGSFKRSYGGLGLGLAVVKKYVELLGGQISVDSEIGKGTEFTLTLPLEAVSVPDTLEHKNAHILVVEDNHTNQMILQGMLKKLGHRVEVTSDGLQAIHRLEKDSFDLILMDCQMPVMDGFETTKKIRAAQTIYSNTPIIAVTANAMAGDRERCLSCGMDDYLEKPVKKAILGEKIDFWLHTRQTANITDDSGLSINDLQQSQR